MPLTGDRKREYQRLWTKQRRDDWIKSQGSMCAICKTTDGPWEVDHIDPSTKICSPKAIWNRAESFRLSELAKCQLLCVQCHKQKTIEENSLAVEHGSYKRGYSKGCKCDLCMEAMRKYWREYRSRPEVAQRRLRPATNR